MIKKAVGLGFGQQDSVGHEFDVTVGAGFVVEADFETNLFSDAGFHLLSDSCRHATSGDSTWLRVADRAGDSITGQHCHEWELSRFAATSFAADHDDLVVLNRLDDFCLSFEDRQRLVNGDFGKSVGAFLA